MQDGDDGGAPDHAQHPGKQARDGLTGLAAQDQLGEDRERDDERDDPLENGRRDDDELPQNPLQALDVLCQPRGGAVRERGQEQRQRHAEERQRGPDRVGEIAHGLRHRVVDDSHRR
ncbi:hypothetical protein [Georgenia sp. SUBG003]|uniref:hypothetical protein n=1 Tax=Georgenia sp. SUBG003 TaxID=1497974 RepID=UPI00069462E0